MILWQSENSKAKTLSSEPQHVLMKTVFLVVVAVWSQGTLSAGQRLLSIVVRLTPISPATGDWLGPSGPCWIPFLWDNSGETGALIVDCDTLATQRRSSEKSWGPSRFFTWPLTSWVVGALGENSQDPRRSPSVLMGWWWETVFQ